MPNSGQWSTGLLGCFSDCESCLCGLCCPCVLIGRYVEILDQGATSSCTGCCLFCCLQLWTGCGFLYTYGYRSRLRRKFDLPASPCGDCLIDCCCLHCSVCQVYRELNNRGIDPKLGACAPQEIIAMTSIVLNKVDLTKVCLDDYAPGCSLAKLAVSNIYHLDLRCGRATLTGEEVVRFDAR